VACVGKRRPRGGFDRASVRSPGSDSAKRAGTSLPYDRLKEFRNGKTIVEGLPLGRFVGPDGLMVLFSLLAAGNLPKGQLLELAKRTQIPGYEPRPKSVGGDFLRSCRAIPRAGILPAVRNTGNDRLGIEAWLKCRAMRNMTVRACVRKLRANSFARSGGAASSTRENSIIRYIYFGVGSALWRAVLVNWDGRTPSDSSRPIDGLANSHAEPQIAAGREPQTMGLNLWSSVTL
jgi:hypothetical protein